MSAAGGGGEQANQRRCPTHSEPRQITCQISVCLKCRVEPVNFQGTRHAIVGFSVKDGIRNSCPAVPYFFLLSSPSPAATGIRRQDGDNST